MAEGQGRSNGQGVKLPYIRDYLHSHATKEHPKNAKAIQAYLASHGIKAKAFGTYHGYRNQPAVLCVSGGRKALKITKKADGMMRGMCGSRIDDAVRRVLPVKGDVVP